jgi:hypothetical protein
MVCAVMTSIEAGVCSGVSPSRLALDAMVPRLKVGTAATAVDGIAGAGAGARRDEGA